MGVGNVRVHTIKKMYNKLKSVVLRVKILFSNLGFVF